MPKKSDGVRVCSGSVHSSDEQVIFPLDEMVLKQQLTNTIHDNRRLKNQFTSLQTDYNDLYRRYLSLHESYDECVLTLALQSEKYDASIAYHLKRIEKYCACLAEAIGLPPEDIQNISGAAPLHDIGNSTIPHDLILKPDPLTEDEYARIRSHTTEGARILEKGTSPLVRRGIEIALNHHEHWDGSGYPHKKRKHDIPLSARIVHLVDIFDALTSRRPHKEPYPLDVGLNFIINDKGRFFDPELVDVLIDNVDKLIKSKAEIDHPENMPDLSYTLSARDRN